MKKIMLYSLIVLMGCQNSPVTNSPEGLYTAYHENEFDKTSDTLIVTKLNDHNVFKISRRASYIRTTDGKVLPKKIIREAFTAKYDSENQLLNEVRTGKVFVLNTEKQLLIWGTTQFVKK